MDITALKIAADAFRSAMHKQDRQGVVAAARRLVELDAPLGQQWPGLAQEVFGWGELNLALSALNAWHRQGASANQANHEKAALLAQSGLLERARALVDALPADFPSPVVNAYLSGALAVSEGSLDAAEMHFRRAVTLRPDSGRSWHGLAQIGKIGEDDRLKMLTLAETGVFEDLEDQAALENALGLVDHDRGEHAAAFAHFEKCTTLVAQQRPYSEEDNRDSAKIAASWSAADLTPADQSDSPSSRQPIFVTGLPRSGTTLVQQILASHSAVDGGAELGLALQIEATVGGFAPADFQTYKLSGGSLTQLRDTYVRLVTERLPGSGPFIDKSLNLSRSLGPFALLFPEAPIIWLRRNAVDNAWSIYRTWLSRNPMSGWSLENIAHHMKLEDELFEHWSLELGERILAVPYAELIERPDHWIERINRHCGLTSEAQQVDFHLSTHAVTTASMQQVRTPLNRSGLNVAQPYLPFLKPFIDTYSA